MQRLGRANLGLPQYLRRSGDMQVSSTTYTGAHALPRHEHEHAYLCLVAAGAYRQHTSGRDSECRQGLLLVHPAGHRHANRFAPQGARCLSVFLPDNLSDTPGPRQLLAEHRQMHLPDMARMLARLDSELVATDNATGLALESAVLELVAMACRHDDSGRHPAWLARVLERLHDNPCDPPRLADLAALAGVHPAHLARRFRQVKGVSVGEYQRGLRINLARDQLADRQRSIADVAAAAGFADQSHFSRVFKRMVGDTPRAFRQKTQKMS